MKLTKSTLKQIIKEELQNVLLEDMNDPNCIKEVTRVKNDGYYPLKYAAFWDAKGSILSIFQRDSETLQPKWVMNKTKADDKVLLAHAMSCLKTKCAKGSRIQVKSDRRITMMQAKPLTEEDFKEAFGSCG